MAKHIELTLNSGGSQLIDPGTTKLGDVFNKKVDWKIKDSRIKSFRIVGKDSTATYYPFKERPNRSFDTHLELEVPWFGETGEWEYKIIWIDKATLQEHTLDPKIAVNPIGFAPLLAVLFIMTIGSIIGIRSFRKRKIAK